MKPPASGIASDAFTTRLPQISRLSAGDKRIGINAQSIRASLGFERSLFAWPVFNPSADNGSTTALQTPIAVLLVHTSEAVYGDDDPPGWGDLFGDERQLLAELLVQLDSLGWLHLA